MIFNSINERFIFYLIPAILFCLLPLSLISGPFLSDLSVSVISLLFLIYCLKKKNFLFFKNKYFYFFLIFWIYLVINSLFNNFNYDSIKISFFYFRFGVFVIAISTLLNENNNFIKYFFICIFFCFLILILDGYFQYFSGENILGYKFESRISSFFGDEHILGSYLSRFWPLFFGLSIFYFKKQSKIFIVFILIFILSEALIFLSGERSAFFYINLSAIFVILFSHKLMKLRVITLISSLFLIVLISYINPTAKERIIDKTLDQMNLSTEQNISSKDMYIFTKIHTEIYISAYKIFLDNKIFGVGVKNFRKFCDKEKYKSKRSCSSHPHNTYLQILTEIGFVGFFFLIFILFYFFKHMYLHTIFKFRGKKYFSDFQICLLSGILIYLWPFVPTGNIFNNWLNITMYLYFPFFIWSDKFSNN